MMWTRRFLTTNFGVIAITALSGCSGDFAGNTPGFSGGGSEKSTSKSTPPTDTEENSEGGEEGEAEDDSEDNDDIKVDETEQCISRDPGFVKVLSFETPPKGFVGTTHANMQLANEYESLYGVKFSSSSGHQAILRQTSRQGEAQPAAGDEAWLCVLCAGSPSRNRLLDAAAETTVGRFVVSSTAAAKNEDGIIRVDYKIPVASLSFDLIDVDGSENWIIESFDAKGVLLPDLTQSVTMDGYNTDRTGNGAPTRIDIATANGSAQIKAFVIRGDKPGSKFGFAFDNFDPGIPSCK
jgi:hypothetical protein